MAEAKSLPRFKYFSDPLGNGSIEAASIICYSCGKPRDYAYVGPVYGEAELGGQICPWCIADGTAHARFDVEFFDAAGIGGFTAGDDVPDPVVEEIVQRTPSFIGWQQGRWFTHCGDAAEFLTKAGKAELVTFGQELIENIRNDIGMSAAQFNFYLELLDKSGEPTAYVFRCRHCGKLGGYSDSL